MPEPTRFSPKVTIRLESKRPEPAAASVVQEPAPWPQEAVEPVALAPDVEPVALEGSEGAHVHAFFRVMRWVHLALAAGVALGVLAQAFLAGQFLMGGGDAALHMDLGWPLAHALAPLVLLVGLATKGGMRVYVGSLVAALLAAVLPNLAADGTGKVAALHPAVAVALFGALVWLVQVDWRLLRAPSPS